MRALKLLFAWCFIAVLLDGCGGGSGGDTNFPDYPGTVTSTLSFPLKSGLAASIAQGSYTNFTISGDCAGSASFSTSFSFPATFEGVAGVATASYETFYFSNCTPSALFGNSTAYYTSDYVPLGSVGGSGYGVFRTAPTIPASVKVHDTGTIGTLDYYADPSKGVSTGYDVLSYVIEPDTANTVIVNMIDRSYNLTGTLTYTEQDRYRMAADGSMYVVSVDIQVAGSSPLHLVLTSQRDMTPPSVSHTSPAGSSTDASTGAAVSANFSESMDQATLTSSTFTLHANGGGAVSGTVASNSMAATFTPAAPLAFSTTYTATITTGVKDVAGNPMSADYAWSFTTAAPDITPPTIVSTIPVSAGTTSVSPQLVANFSEAMDPATVTNAEFTLSDGTNSVPGSVVLHNGTQAVFTPDSGLTQNATYTATVSTGVRDLAGNPLGSSYSWTFTTVGLETIPPTLLSTNPANNAVGVGINGDIAANFDEQVNPTGAVFTVMNGATSVPGTVHTIGTTDVTFTPSAPLVPNTLYTASISGVKDAWANVQVGTYNWSFTTADVLFMNPVLIPSYSTVEAVAIGDVNGDGRNDLVTVTSFTRMLSADPTEYKLSVFLQDSSGGLAAPVRYATHGTMACRGMTIALGDINHDGRNDVVIGDSGCGIEVFTQNAGGGLDSGVVYATADSHVIRIADVNHDGLLDVVGIGWNGTTVSVLHQNAGGTLDAPVVIGNIGMGGLTSIATGDVNNDGYTDIIIAGSRVGVMTQIPGGTFNTPVIYSNTPMSDYFGGLEAGDVNGDGLSDVVVANSVNRLQNSRVGVLMQNGSGTLNSETSYSSYDIPTATVVADVTGDGRKDVVVLHVGWSSIGIYRQLGDGTLNAEERINTPSDNHNAQAMAVGDLNGDGKSDVVVGTSIGAHILYHY